MVRISEMVFARNEVQRTFFSHHLTSTVYHDLNEACQKSTLFYQLVGYPNANFGLTASLTQC